MSTTVFKRAAGCGAEKLREYIRYVLSLESITQSHTLETMTREARYMTALNRKPDLSSIIARPLV